MMMDFWNNLAVGRPSNATAQAEHMSRIATEHGYPSVEMIGDRAYARETYGKTDPSLRNGSVYAARDMGRWALMASTGGEMDFSNATDVSSFGAPDQFEAFRQRIAASEIRTGDKNIILREIETIYDEDGSIAGQTMTDNYLPEIAAVEDGRDGFTVIGLINNVALTVAPTARRKDNVVMEQRLYRVYTWVRLDRKATSSYLENVATEVKRIVDGPAEDYYKSLFLVRSVYDSNDDVRKDRDGYQNVMTLVCYAKRAYDSLRRKTHELMDKYEHLLHETVYRLTPDPIESEYTDQASAIPEMPGMPKPQGEKQEDGDGQGSPDGSGAATPGEDDVPPMPGQPGTPGGDQTGGNSKIKHAGHDEDWWVAGDDK